MYLQISHISQTWLCNRNHNSYPDIQFSADNTITNFFFCFFRTCSFNFISPGISLPICYNKMCHLAPPSYIVFSFQFIWLPSIFCFCNFDQFDPYFTRFHSFFAFRKFCNRSCADSLTVGSLFVIVIFCNSNHAWSSSVPEYRLSSGSPTCSGRK